MARFGLMNVLIKFKPVYYRRYIDNIFVFFISSHHLEKFKNDLNSQYRNIRNIEIFFCEKKHNSMNCLDIFITTTNNGFETSIHLQPTFNEVYLFKLKSFISKLDKFGFIFTL